MLGLFQHDHLSKYCYLLILNKAMYFLLDLKVLNFYAHSISVIYLVKNTQPSGL